MSIFFRTIKHEKESYILNQSLLLFQIKCFFYKTYKNNNIFSLYIDKQTTNPLKLQNLKVKIQRNFNKVKTILVCTVSS